MLVIIGRPFFCEPVTGVYPFGRRANTRLGIAPRGNTRGLRPAAGGSGILNEGTMGTPTHLSLALSLPSSQTEASGFPDCRGEWQYLDPAAEIEPC